MGSTRKFPGHHRAAPGSSPDTTAQHPDISWKARPNPEVPGKVLFEYGNIQKLPDDISIGNIQKLPDDIVPLPEGGSSWKKTIEVEPYSAVEKLPDDISIGNIQKLPDDFVPLPEGGSSWKKTIEVEPYSAVEKLPDGTTKIKSTDCDASIAGIRKQYSDFMDNLKRKGNQQ